MNKRILASIEKVVEVKTHPNADNLDIIKIKGWSVVSRRAEFSEGDLCVYFSIDSLLPDWPQFEFLRKSSWNERLGKYRLKTAKLRGVISQGLALPVSAFPGVKTYEIGDDLTQVLAIEKYEPPIPASLGGEVNRFTWPIPRTDEERIQNIPEVLNQINGKPYYITIKLDGASGSFMLTKNDEGEIEFHACSRNYSIRRKEGNTIWEIVDKYDIEKKLKDWYLSTGEMLAIQGEIVGPGIQKNRLNLPNHQLYIFNIVDVETGEKKHLNSMRHVFTHIPMVPILEEGDSFPYTSLEEILKLAEGKYKDHIETAMAKQEREGIVIRTQDQSISFKAISNRFLLKGGE